MDITLSHRLEAAVTLLAGDGTLKERLAAAYREHLDDIDELELPNEVQLEYSQMSRTMHLARALPGDNVVRASVRKLSNEEAQRFAALIVRMYSLRMQSLTSGTKPPARISATPRSTTSLVSLLAIEGGGSGGGSRTGVANTP
ncbi:MAG TPA: hypothetical protein VKC11_13495 [Steroidobacteraceae bacterium]|nr:hypothetical protein [Steroidobacteraceae bacterium]